MEPTDVIVIGAGPAGSAAAALVHRAGLSVRVVEQTRFPRFVIGESLLPRCMDILDEAGLLDAVKARGYQVKNGALFVHGAERCSFDFHDQHTRGWSWTWQVPRADFDQTLATEVERMGVPVHWATKVTAVDLPDGPGPRRLTVVDESGATHVLSARFVIDASGYGRVLPRLLGLDEPSGQPPRRALFAHVEGDRRPSGPDQERIWICIHPEAIGAWLWIIPFSDGRTSVGAVSDPGFFEGFQADTDEARLRAIIASEPGARERLSDARFLFPPRTLAGYSSSVKRLWGPGYCLVGNATEFLDPVFSSGVTLALESASRAARLAVRELGGEAVDWDREFSAPMMRGIDVFRTFVERWYDGTLARLFFAPRKDDRIRAQICSVLAGYVWDETNPLVRDHARRVPFLAAHVGASPS
jgi:2-polyprenyl-6-methoxyphenol hydroxylase-like FAD-dependent oxidoreductase